MMPAELLRGALNDIGIPAIRCSEMSGGVIYVPWWAADYMDTLMVNDNCRFFAELRHATMLEY